MALKESHRSFVSFSRVLCLTLVGCRCHQDAATVCDSNMWRSGGDIGNGFGGALSEAHQWFAKNNLSATHPWGAAPISRPGCWGYPDMMEIGNFCKDPLGSNPKCEDEERAHFGLWCIMSSPLVL